MTCRFPAGFNRVMQYCWALLLFIPLNTARADDIHVAVASNFTGPISAIAKEFETRYPHRVMVSSGSSGKLYAQIRHGAPYHILFSADQEKPALLEKEGFAVPGSRFTYAIGKLVLWSSRPDMITATTSPHQLLVQDKVKRIALANPRLAPYGAAAEDVLEALGIKEQTRSRWVQGENIAQTYQFVRTGNADLGFVALSQLISGPDNAPGAYLSLAENLYRPILQDAVLLNKGQAEAAAQLFLTFVLGDAAAKLIQSFGYEAPPKRNASQ